MNDYIIIKVTNSIDRFIKKCKKYNIDLLDIKYLSNKEIIIKINKKDLKNIERYNYYSNIEIYKKLGKDKLIEKIYNLKYLIITFLLCIVFMYIISNIIFKINIIHSNKEIREKLYNELETYGIHKYSFKKKFNELEKIKNDLLENNKDSLEWISITNVGMKYIIRVEERILDNLKKEENYCDIISTKEALITDIYATNGEIVKDNNDYVHKDEVLISGDIYLNEELKGITCANGIVKGKVWYTTSVTINRIYYKKEYTNNKRYNLTINNKIFKKTKYEKYDKEYIIKNNIFSLYKELEYKNVKYIYNETDGIKKAMLEIEEKFNSKLDKHGKIIETKILSKNINDTSITLNVFVITEENIGKQIIKSQNNNLSN